jgi:hypothetical protein
MSTWILYNIQTGTVLETDPDQPTGYSPDKATAQVSFKFMSGQPPIMHMYNGSDVVPNVEENIQLFNPFLSSEISAVNTYAVINLISSPELNQTVFVRDVNMTFEYNGSEWVQCGAEVILREGLGSGYIYALNTKIG